MSIETVVPATLLADIKKGLIALGYATEATPLSFVQDAYLKYVMVNQVTMGKGFSPEIPYAIGLLPQAIQDQLSSGSAIVGIFDQWGNTGGLLSGPSQSAVLTEVSLRDFDYAVTRTGFTDCKQADFAWVIGTTNFDGAMQDPMVGDAAFINRRGQLELKVEDFAWFEMVLSKSNGFPIGSWPLNEELNDKVPLQPSESVYLSFDATQPGILKPVVNRVPATNVDIGQDAESPTRLIVDVNRNPENINEVRVSISAANGFVGSVAIVDNVNITFPESGTLNLSCHAITKVGKESTIISITSKVNTGIEM